MAAAGLDQLDRETFFLCEIDFCPTSVNGFGVETNLITTIKAREDNAVQARI